MKYGGEPGYKGGKDLFLYPCALFFFFWLQDAAGKYATPVPVNYEAATE